MPVKRRKNPVKEGEFPPFLALLNNLIIEYVSPRIEA